MSRFTTRDVNRAAAAAFGFIVAAGGRATANPRTIDVHPVSARTGHLSANPKPPPQIVNTAPGQRRLGLGGARDGLMFVPSRLDPTLPAPVVVLLHGAGGNAHDIIGILSAFAEQRGFILLAPESRRETWDIIRGEYGPDIAFIDEALEQLFRSVPVDPERLAIAGFSDGASYALSVGVMNGDLLTHVIAFSPGFTAPAAVEGSPMIFVSHGDADRVLPIDRCSRRIVPSLKRAGYSVRYDEFAGGHPVPAEIARAAVDWFLAG